MGVPISPTFHHHRRGRRGSLPVCRTCRQRQKRAARLEALQGRQSCFTAGYTGHLYAGRGGELMIELAARLPEITFLLVGGEPPDVARLQAKVNARQLDNVILTGFIPNADLPLYQAACDVLLMPYQKPVAASSGGDIAPYLSPMKLFEYLACGRAILSSDLPVLREVLNPANAVLLDPETSRAWAAALRLCKTIRSAVKAWGNKPVVMRPYTPGRRTPGRSWLDWRNRMPERPSNHLAEPAARG